MHAEEDILSARTFPVSRAVLFGAFADPAVLAKWWGPQGSVSAFEQFDFRPGGMWRFTMRAADGTVYPMLNQFVEIVPPERLTIRHIQADHEFQLRMQFEAIGEALTRLSWRMSFASAVEARRVHHFVREANEQNLDRLEAALGLPATRRGASGGTGDTTV